MDGQDDNPAWAQEPIQGEPYNEENDDEEAPSIVEGAAPPPAWMASDAPVVMDQAQIPSNGMDGPSHAQPGWFNAGFSQQVEQKTPIHDQSSRTSSRSGAYDVVDAPAETSDTAADLCFKWCSRTFCSFRTPLAPLLMVASALSLYGFIARFVLNCDWNTGVIQTGAFMEFAAASLFLFSVCKEKGWYCCGWFISILFALLSAIIAICEWVVEDCDNNWTDGTDGDDDVTLPGWSIPAADSVLVVTWALCSYLFDLGSKDEKREGEAMREKRRPLLNQR
mmetsp:Transcript_56323/g.96959  ORF Transcript_56323/g.96959 Transcript_56323/m.96959 type:complete len:279 (+) Transcript_56323:40-876(+)